MALGENTKWAKVKQTFNNIIKQPFLFLNIMGHYTPIKLSINVVPKYDPIMI